MRGKSQGKEENNRRNKKIDYETNLMLAVHDEKGFFS
jgi:hypothetical protein